LPTDEVAIAETGAQELDAIALGLYIEANGQAGVQAFINRGTTHDYALEITDKGIREIALPTGP